MVNRVCHRLRAGVAQKTCRSYKWVKQTMEEPGDAQCCNSPTVLKWFVLFFEFGAANKSGELVRYLISGWREHTHRQAAANSYSFSSIKFSVDSGGGLRGATRTENSHRAPEWFGFVRESGFVLVRNILLAAVRVWCFSLLFPLCADGQIRWPPTRVWIRALRRKSRIPGKDHWTAIRKTEIRNGLILVQVTLHFLRLAF